ncbi:HIT family protein [Sphaerisporangium fuscum]|uniref:HIT family protein n=1 Tax=Sphaerisporangium fuscum TaxID=2835868 RepID=UPI001BDC9628|nr:HIT family protein [Sphaerisporangium fuscum]
MDDCTFCKIAVGQAPGHRVLHDKATVAFLDIAPAAPGHTLVVPRTHARDIWDLPEEEHARVARMVHRVARLLKTALAPDGLTITHASGAAAGQDVFHFHTHVIPRWSGDGLRPKWASRRAPEEDLQAIQARIQAAR